MLLEVIPMFCFENLRIFGEKFQKSKHWKSGHIRLLRHSVGNPRRGVDLRQGVGSLVVVKLRCKKWHPLGTPQRSKATSRQRPMT